MLQLDTPHIPMCYLRRDVGVLRARKRLLRVYLKTTKHTPMVK